MLPPHRSLAFSAAALLVLGAFGCAPDGTTPSGDLSDHLSVDQATAQSTGHQHEPLGFTTVTKNTTDALPPSFNFFSSTPGVWKMVSAPTARLVTDATAPCSPPRVWSTTYKAGMQAGRGPITLWSQGKTGAPPESRRWYIQLCMKLGRNGLYENQAVGTKLFFISLADDPSIERCAVIPRAKGDVVQAIKSSWTVWAGFECAGILPNATFYQIAGAGRPLKSDVWQVHEWLLDAGDIDQANGRFQWWIDGKLVLDKRNQKFRTHKSGMTHGINRWRWAPTWGGIGGTRTRDDDYQIDNVYVSGQGKP